MSIISVAVSLAGSAIGADLYIDGDWEELAPVILDRNKVVVKTGTPEPLPLAVVDKPLISEARFLIAGEVEYTDATGYLEMWSVFGEKRYFSRTLGETGPMAKLEGTASWRRFMLPFNATRGMVPDRIEINAVLPGGGMVAVRNLKLYQTKAALVTPQEAFWTWSKLPGLLLAAAAIGMSVFLWVRCSRKKRAERELRAMTASDIAR